MRRLGPFGSVIVLLCLAACLAPGGYLLATKDGRDWNAIKREIREKYPDVDQLSVDAFAARLEQHGPPPLVVDVRAAPEFAISHLAGARNVPFGSDYASAFADVPREREIVLYCSVGYRSSIVAHELAGLGFDHVKNLEGSIFEWANSGRPLVGPKGQANVVHPYDSEWGTLLLERYRAALDDEQEQGASAARLKTGATFLGLLLFLLLETLAPAFRFFDRDRRSRWVHALRNFAMQGLNALVVAFVFAGLLALAATSSAERGLGLLHALDWPTWAEAIVAVLLLDVWTYFWHRANHRVPFLWRFHRMHHSDPNMDVTTANRFHVGEIAMSTLLRVGLVFLLGLELWHLLLYEAWMFPIVQFHHANISLGPRLERWLSVLIVTPAMHKVHHSRTPADYDSNYTSLLSVWDRVFRSFRWRDDGAGGSFGVEGFLDDESQRLLGMLRTPVTGT